MNVIGKLNDVVLGPKNAVMLDRIIETNDQYEITYAYLSPPVIGGVSSGPLKISGKTLGRKGSVILKELDSKKEHYLDYYVIDFKDMRGYPKDVQILNPNLISEEQLDKLVQKTGESFEIRMKKTIPEQSIHTILEDYSLYDHVYSRLHT
ncbi:hypothetical protein ISS05_05135 [Candidatus Woesearchaeota archaeon]|nr:hypothetical protein [Candidatus Woesearchaeota archaeon]